jgi:hypothetical protein
MFTERNPNYNDWREGMQKFFDTFSVKSVLEFGLGDGTSFLLENNRKVTSVELLSEPVYKGWFEEIRMLHSLDDWTGIMYECTNEYTKETKEFIESVISDKYDIIFIDPGVQYRPSIVNTCIDNNIPVMVAHDTDAILHAGNDWSQANPDKAYYEVLVHRTTYYFRDKEMADKFREAVNG